jgi:hypothetical protein
LLGAHEDKLPETKAKQRRPSAPELDLESVPGHLVLHAGGLSKLDAGHGPAQAGENRSQSAVLVLPLAAASGLLVPRNHWIAKVWLRAVGERVAIGGLATIVAVLLLAYGRVTQPGPPPSPVSSPPQVPPSRVLFTSVAAGVAPVLVGALAQPFAELATSAAATPGELEMIVQEDVVAPFLHAGSTKLGDALADALVQCVRRALSPRATPPHETVTQVQDALQQKLTAELAFSPALRAIAARGGPTPDQLAARLANAIAGPLARDLAYGLVRVPSSRHLGDSCVATIAAGVIQQQLSRQPIAAPPGRPYTVRPGDSLWRISQRLLGPGATAQEIDHAWRVIYRENHATIGADPNHIVPGQGFRMPRSLQAALSRGWVLVPWLVVAPGTLTGTATRRRRRSNRA